MSDSYAYFNALYLLTLPIQRCTIVSAVQVRVSFSFKSRMEDSCHSIQDLAISAHRTGNGSRKHLASLNDNNDVAYEELLQAKPTEHLEKFLEHIGAFGRFQLLQYIIMCLVQLLIGTSVFTLVFTGATPEFVCSSNATFVWDKFKQNASSEPIFKPNVCYQNCSQYIFNEEVYGVTAVQEFGLICNERSIMSMTKSLFFVGRFVGALLSGVLADSHGRKFGFIVGIIIFAISGLMVALAQSHILLAIGFLIRGLSHITIQNCSYVLAFELIGPSKKKLGGIIILGIYSVGYIVLPFFAYFIRQWRYLEMVFTLPSILFVFYGLYLPESPRWLLTKGRVDEAISILRRAAKFNKVEIDQKDWDSLEENLRSDHLLKTNKKESDERETFESKRSVSKLKSISLQTKTALCTCNVVQLFSGSLMKRITFIVWISWFSLSMSFYGLSFNIEKLKGSPYINFAIFGIINIPAYILDLLLVDCMGRRILLVVSTLLGGISTLTSAFLPIITDMYLIHVIIAMIGLFFISAAYGLVNFYTVELFPTSIRNIGLGSASMAARIGGALSPIILDLQLFYTPLPIIILGCIVTAAGISSLALPETRGRPLPQTVEDLVHLHATRQKKQQSDLFEKKEQEI